MADRQYAVYMLTNPASTVLYTGVTNDLKRRTFEHRENAIDGFTKRYNVNRLVHFEATGDVRAALEREKELKGWRRSRKIALIEKENPGWRDLSLEWDRL